MAAGEGGGLARGTPRGLRDTRSWYLDVDPLSVVDEALVDFVAERGGPVLLDLGCGLGGYTRALGERGFDVRGLDVREEYVQRARELGVRAEHYDGGRIPLEDASVDTVFLLEVIEHLDDPGSLLAEARRVARRNVLVSTPNCTQSFGLVPVEFAHMLDVDHRQSFTVPSLGSLLEEVFGNCHVWQVAPLDAVLASLMAPRFLRPVCRALDRWGLFRPRFFARLLGEAEVTA